MNPAQAGSIANIIANIIAFINNILVPFVFAIAFIVFLYGVLQYFFLKGATDPKARAEGSKFIFGAVIAFAVMLTVWGLVNIVKGTLNLDTNQPALPVFNPGGTNNSSGSTGTQTGDVPVAPAKQSGQVPAQTSPTPPGNTVPNQNEVQGLY